ncbi:MAG TPA: 16S rRNA (cytosine(1402)-N(4))-methyltransferase RsmH [Candidatus Desulfovibrio intestinavium]|uniref:Ribosomal RNA small subunit methyltransferase H n=1 Tax=Candidatus Desulfovibrio intestinavium TaxID=2838534 RepID=A0A9D2KRJ3_9BACT|nr:16S rRNA (cytosine(1402)-N(4))-methyltransferase RsmH [Candidatus Desulfovibrio intestinavium]
MSLASSVSDIASRHLSVLPRETLAVFAPLWTEGEGDVRLLDGTLGLGGHTQALLEASPRVRVCGLDRDEEALALARQRLAPHGDRFRGFHICYSRFAEALDELGWDRLDGALLDIGVSSLQLDEAQRGFSFYGDGPLDMRMDQQSGRPSAWHWVNRESFDRLRDCIATLGEEPQAGRIARTIVEARQKDSIDTTAQLAALVERAYPPAWRAKARRHPATRTFQALRMAVNDELGELQAFLDAILGRLRVGGRLAVICFHSLEDRMVKQAMRHWAEGCRCPRHVMRCVCGHEPEVRILFKKPVQAGEDELARNLRASSAKLRAAEKIAEAATAGSESPCA